MNKKIQSPASNFQWYKQQKMTDNRQLLLIDDGK